MSDSSQGRPTSDELREFGGMVARYKAGEMIALMIHMGDRLGLYETLAGAGPVTASDLAGKTGLKERWLLEWLRGQAAAEIIAYRGDDRFELTPVAEVVLSHHSSPWCFAGFFSAPTSPEIVNRMADAFRSGIGLSWDDHGPEVARMLERMTGPVHALLPNVISLLDGTHEVLEKGGRVVDVGCGAGVALLVLAKAYPKAEFWGYDPSPEGIDRARASVQKEGLSNVHLEIAGGEDLPGEPSFDLVMTLDCMHDLPHPEQVIEAIRRAIKPDGCWLIKDIRSSSRFEENLEDPMSPLMYGMSVLYCMSSSLSQPGGAGLGTMGFSPDVAREMTGAGGFTRFQQLEFDADPINLFYAVRP